MKMIKDFLTVNHWPNRNGYKPIAIVNHITEGSASSARNWFKNPAAETSSNFIVSQDGTIFYMVPITKAAWCNGGVQPPADRETQIIRENRGVNPNLFTVSIEHEGVYAKTRGALTPKQLEATIELHRWIIDEVKRQYGHSISIDRDHIIGHRDITPQSRPNCPGEKFPFDEIIKALTDPASGEIPIKAKPSVTVTQMQKWANNNNAANFFVDLAPTFFELSSGNGVDPAVAYALSAHETAFGRFGGVLDATFKNPCGMKTATGGGDYDKNAHQRFPSWRMGILAEVHHLALYAGDFYDETPDPRHYKWVQGRAKTVEALGGNWAPSKSYGQRVAEKVRAMQKTHVKTDEGSVVYHNFPRGYYRALQDLDVYYQPYTAKTKGRRGLIPKGVVVLAVEELREGVTGVQLRLANGAYVMAQQDTKIFVEAYRGQ